MARGTGTRLRKGRSPALNRCPPWEMAVWLALAVLLALGVGEPALAARVAVLAPEVEFEAPPYGPALRAVELAARAFQREGPSPDRPGAGGSLALAFAPLGERPADWRAAVELVRREFGPAAILVLGWPEAARVVARAVEGENVPVVYAGPAGGGAGGPANLLLLGVAGPGRREAALAWAEGAVRGQVAVLGEAGEGGEWQVAGTGRLRDRVTALPPLLPGTPDLGLWLRRLARLRPAGLLVDVPPAAAWALLQQGAERGVLPPSVVLLQADQALLGELAAAAPPGVRLFALMEWWPELAEEKQAARAFQNAYQEVYGTSPDISAARAYAAALWIGWGVRRFGEEPGQLLAGLGSTPPPAERLPLAWEDGRPGRILPVPGP